MSGAMTRDGAPSLRVNVISAHVSLTPKLWLFGVKPETQQDGVL